VELGEIEKALSHFTEYKSVVASVHSGTIAAYVTVDEECSAPETSEVLSFCATQLPPYAVPRAVVCIEAIPLSSNGKVDRKRLPAPTLFATASLELVAPNGSAEQQVAQMFSSVLSTPIESVGATDSFFQLGGDSLAALRLLSTLRKCFGVQIGVPWLFQNPTVREIAASLAAPSHPGDRQKQLAVIQLSHGDAGSQGVPLVLMHAAGSSAMAYSALAKELRHSGSTYAIEDGALTGASPFSFSSIGDAAEAMVNCILEDVLEEDHRVVSLGGWSYGGVVALEAARLLVSRGFSVQNLVIVDSPLKVRPALHKQNAPEMQIEGLSSEESALAQQHFASCTTLLQGRNEEWGQQGHLLGLCDRIVHVIAGVESALLSEFDLGHVSTTGQAQSVVINGASHWDILSPQHVKLVAEAIRPVLDC